MHPQNISAKTRLKFNALQISKRFASGPGAKKDVGYGGREWKELNLLHDLFADKPLDDFDDLIW